MSNDPSWLSRDSADILFQVDETQTPTAEIVMRHTPSFVAILLPLCLGAQEQERPKDWNVRFDRADATDSALFFVTMTPGWHVTTGPAGILYNPSQTATGTFRVESEIFLFNPGDRQREAFGVFFGGEDLEGAGQGYTYFLIRNDGSFLIKRRDGTKTITLQEWTPTEAMVRHDGGDGTAKNILAVEVGTTHVSFYVNGGRVASIPKASMHTDGVVGLRVNHNLNLHISSLSVES